VRQHPRWALAAGLGLLLILGGAGFLFGRSLSGWGPRSLPNAHESWLEAQRTIEARDFEAAKEHLQRCLEICPFNAEVHFLLARTSRRSGDLAAWRREMQTAQVLQWAKEDIDMERRLAQAQSGALPDADRVLRVSLDKHPADEILIWEVLVQGYIDKRLPNEILATTGDWIARHPNDWLAYFYRGYANLDLGAGKSLKAIEDFRQVLELKPDRVEARFSLAYAYTKLGRYQDALEQFQACLQSRPNDPVALRGVATCQLSLSEPEAARAALDALPDEQKASASVYLLRAKLAWVDVKAEEALQWAKRAEALAPTDLEVIHTLAMVLRHLKKDAEAAKYQRRFEELGRLEEQLSKLQERIWQNPTDLEARFQAALTCHRLDRDSQEEYWLKTIQAMNADPQATLRAYADYLEKHDNPERAALFRRQAQSTEVKTRRD
jgi:thioredoxin-like negative regulator of GroEL